MKKIAIEPNVIYTSREVRQILNVGEKFLTPWIKNGLLRPMRVGFRRHRFSGQEILNFVKILQEKVYLNDIIKFRKEEQKPLK